MPVTVSRQDNTFEGRDSSPGSEGCLDNRGPRDGATFLPLLRLEVEERNRHLGCEIERQALRTEGKTSKYARVVIGFNADSLIQVWSELGFSAVLGTAAVGEIDVPGTYHFNLGLHKQHIVQDHKKHRGLPSSMANPPEISPPRETPTATLASVDISLEYCLYEKDIPQHSHSLVSGLVFNQRGSLSVSPFNLELELQGMAQPRLPGTDCDFVWLEETLHEALPHHTEPRIHHTPTVEPPTSHGALQRLFEIGMERLMTSKRPRDSEIFILEGASLASLAEIAPVVFKPGYREVSPKLPSSYM